MSTKEGLPHDTGASKFINETERKTEEHPYLQHIRSDAKNADKSSFYEENFKRMLYEVRRGVKKGVSSPQEAAEFVSKLDIVREKSKFKDFIAEAAQLQAKIEEEFPELKLQGKTDIRR